MRLIHVLRQDPDVIVVGEMRDLETISTAMSAAETGHLVLGNFAYAGCQYRTIQRIFSVVSLRTTEQTFMYQLSNSLQAILAQNLLPKASGGRVLACEVWRHHGGDSQAHPRGIPAPDHVGNSGG